MLSAGNGNEKYVSGVAIILSKERRRVTVPFHLPLPTGLVNRVKKRKEKKKEKKERKGNVSLIVDQSALQRISIQWDLIVGIIDYIATVESSSSSSSFLFFLHRVSVEMVLERCFVLLSLGVVVVVGEGLGGGGQLRNTIYHVKSRNRIHCPTQHLMFEDGLEKLSQVQK